MLKCCVKSTIKCSALADIVPIHWSTKTGITTPVSPPGPLLNSNKTAGESFLLQSRHVAYFWIDFRLILEKLSLSLWARSQWWNICIESIQLSQIWRPFKNLILLKILCLCHNYCWLLSVIMPLLIRGHQIFHNKQTFNWYQSSILEVIETCAKCIENNIKNCN